MSERTCSNCDAAIPPQAQFCTQCGTPSPTDAGAPTGATSLSGQGAAESPTQDPTLVDRPGPAASDDVNATRSFAVGGVPTPPPPPPGAAGPSRPPGTAPGAGSPPPPSPGAGGPPSPSPSPPSPPSPYPPGGGAPPPQGASGQGAQGGHGGGAPQWAPAAGPTPAWQQPTQAVPPAAPPAAPWQQPQPPPRPQGQPGQWQSPGQPQPQWQQPGQAAGAWSAGQIGTAPPKAKGGNLVPGIIALAGAVLLVVGVFTPWVRTSDEVTNGFSASDDAKVLLAVGIVALALGAVLVAGVRHILLRSALVVLGVVTLVYSVVDILSVTGSDNETAAIGVGLILVPIAGVLLCLAGALTKHRTDRVG